MIKLINILVLLIIIVDVILIVTVLLDKIFMLSKRNTDKEWEIGFTKRNVILFILSIVFLIVFYIPTNNESNVEYTSITILDKNSHMIINEPYDPKQTESIFEKLKEFKYIRAPYQTILKKSFRITDDFYYIIISVSEDDKSKLYTYFLFKGEFQTNVMSSNGQKFRLLNDKDLYEEVDLMIKDIIVNTD